MRRLAKLSGWGITGDNIDTMRRGGMLLPDNEGHAYRILSIVVKQNGGMSEEGRNWPEVFYREGRGDIRDKVGLLEWKKTKTE